MHIKVINPKTDGSKVYDNLSSVDQLVEYLEHEMKEGSEQGSEKQEGIFFDRTRGEVSSEEVKVAINQNIKGVRAHEEKFFAIVISPSEDELRHIGNNDQKLQEYTREVMEQYAANFRLKDGKRLDSSNLVWYATIHNDREVKHLDLQREAFLSEKEKERIEKLSQSDNPRDHTEIERIKEQAQKRNAQKLDDTVFQVGDKKPGMNKHIHVIVSRRDATQTITLNPRTRKERFDIRSFQQKSAQRFQQMFGYEKDPLQKGFYQGHSEQDKAYFYRKIEAAAEQMNKHTGEEKIDAERLKNVGEKCNFSRAYFINLGKLKGKFQQGEFVNDPYFFAERGRDQKEREYFSKLDEKTYTYSDRNIRAYPVSNYKYQDYERATPRDSPSNAVKLLSALGSLRAGQLAIKETFLFDHERKRYQKHREKGQDRDNIELD